MAWSKPHGITLKNTYHHRLLPGYLVGSHERRVFTLGFLFGASKLLSAHFIHNEVAVVN